MTTDLFTTGYRAASRLLELAATSDETRVLVATPGGLHAWDMIEQSPSELAESVKDETGADWRAVADWLVEPSFGVLF